LSLLVGIPHLNTLQQVLPVFHEIVYLYGSSVKSVGGFRHGKLPHSMI